MGSTTQWMGCGALVAALALSSGCAAPEEIDDLSYDRRFDDTVMDLYLPDDHGTARAAVMLVHGGGWQNGDKRAFRTAARRLARSGYVAASINYRLAPEGRFPRAPQDVACALAFLQQRGDEYGIDPRRIAIMGYSAGGHLVSLLGVAWDRDELEPDCAVGRPARPAAVIPGAGVHDLRGAEHEWVEEFLGGSEDEVPEAYRLASPILHVDAGEPPFLLINGGADWLVEADQSRAMRETLRAAGNRAELLTMAGSGHLIQPAADPGEVQIAVSLDTPEAWLAVADFLERTLGGP